MVCNTVIFDLFGTLVDDFQSWAGPMQNELVAALGVLPEPFNQLWRQTTEMRIIGDFQTAEASIEYVCGAVGAPITAEQLRKAVEIRLRYTKRALNTRPHGLTTLASLKNTGHKIGLLSNCSVEIPILWPETKFADFIEQPIFSCLERLKKPDPRMYNLACERLEVRPQECLYVADGENHELKAAKEVGLHPVLIRTSSQETRGEVLREAREWRGDAISTLSEVLTLVGVKDNQPTT